MPSLRLLPPRNFIIKLKSRCSSNSDKETIRRFLHTTLRVHSVKLDPYGETVAISGTVKPTEIITQLKQGLGLKATLFWEVSTGGQSLMRAKDIYRVFTARRENNVAVNMRNVQQNDDMKSNCGGVGIFSVSSSCCGSFSVALVHVPVNRNMFDDSRSGNDHGSSNYIHSNNLQYSPPHVAAGYIPPPFSGGYAPSAPPMETAENHYRYASPPPPPPPPPPHAPAPMGLEIDDDEYYFDAPPPVRPEPDVELSDSFSDQYSSDDEYPTTSCIVM